MAVMTPTGISAGAIKVRPTVSHRIRKLAPKNIEPGIKSRKSGPIIRRTICGTINPTNPIGPLIATTVPVISDMFSVGRRPLHTTTGMGCDGTKAMIVHPGDLTAAQMRKYYKAKPGALKQKTPATGRF